MASRSPRSSLAVAQGGDDVCVRDVGADYDVLACVLFWGCINKSRCVLLVLDIGHQR